MVRKLHKIHCSRFLCTLCTITVENSVVLPLRTKIAVEKGLGTMCLFWLLVRGIPVLMTYFEPCFQQKTFVFSRLAISNEL